MRIRVRLFATLQQYLPPGSNGSETSVELPDGATPVDALDALSVPAALAHIVFVNGRHVLRTDLGVRQLAAGETLSVFPAIGGG